jgi:hypothetical protein
VLAYVVGYFVLLAVLGWQPDEPHSRKPVQSPAPGALTIPAVKP